ncbi:MAG TPA: CYTH and CHAD domain-containing protein [Aldersonia sp.]
MREYLEREDKYDVDDDFVVPDVTEVVGGTRAETSQVELVNAYLDTADGDLRNRKVTLRRRTGGADEGWQMKVPRHDGRVEVQFPLGDGDEVPGELTELVLGVGLGKPLVPAVTMTTRRQITKVLDDAGAVLIEIADDRVAARSPDGATQAWREVEAELGSAPPEALATIRDRMLAAGASVAASSSKLARVLGGPAEPQGNKAQVALASYLATQVDAILLGDIALRRGADPIHATRVAIRRLRSALRIFAEEVRVPADLDGELRQYAGLLGVERDRQVQRAYFTKVFADLEPEYVIGSAEADLDAHLAAEEAKARTRILQALRTDRYRAMLAALVSLAADPATVAGATPGGMRKAARRAERQADRRLDLGLQKRDDVLLHRGRRAAKRARYAAEIAEPVLGRKAAKDLVDFYKQVQELLGEHQDAMVADETLLAAARRVTGPEGFTYGLLYAREQERARRSLVAFRKMWA